MQHFDEAQAIENNLSWERSRLFDLFKLLAVICFFLWVFFSQQVFGRGNLQAVLAYCVFFSVFPVSIMIDDKLKHMRLLKRRLLRLRSARI